MRSEDIPPDLVSQSEAKRQELVEHVSNVDDQLGELFLGKHIYVQFS